MPSARRVHFPLKLTSYFNFEVGGVHTISPSWVPSVETAINTIRSRCEAGSRARCLSSPCGAEGAICLGGEVKVTLGQSADLVRPDFHRALAPCDVEIWMMALAFCDVGHFVREGHGLHEIRERVRAVEMTIRVKSPAIVQLAQQLFGTDSFHRWNSTAARDALLVG